MLTSDVRPLRNVRFSPPCSHLSITEAKGNITIWQPKSQHLPDDKNRSINEIREYLDFMYVLEEEKTVYIEIYQK